MKRVLYRYVGYRSYDLSNPWEIEVLRETKCGYWVVDHSKYPTGEKWISATGKKRFAYPTKEEAMVSYIARKQSQIKHLNRMLKLARHGLSLASNDKLLATVKLLEWPLI